MDTNIALLGGGGLAFEIAGYLAEDGIVPLGYYDIHENSQMRGILPYLGDEHENHDKDTLYIIASGHMLIRRRMIDFIRDHMLRVKTFVSSHAHISPFAHIGSGSIIAAQSTIGGNAVCGPYLLANIGSSVGHDCRIGSNVVLSPKSSINGRCLIGNNTYISSGVSTNTGISIGDDCFIGLDTSVVSDVPDDACRIGHMQFERKEENDNFN